jgi:hypothetical protein
MVRNLLGLAAMGNASYARYENNPARQAAYELWRIDPSKPVTELMPAIDEVAGEKVAVRTVQRWRHDDRWELRYAEEEAARSGILVIEHVKRLRVAAPVHVSYLDKVARGLEKYDRGRVEVAKFLVTEAGRLLSVLPAVQVAVTAEATASLSDLSIEELLAMTSEEQE